MVFSDYVTDHQATHATRTYPPFALSEEALEFLMLDSILVLTSVNNPVVV